MEEPSQNVLSDAKAAYTKQLVFTLAPRILEGFLTLFEDAVQFKEEANDPRFDDYSEIEVFQDSLRKIPKWNQDIIDGETKRIVDRSRCEYLDELLAAVFISHAKVMSSIRFHNPSHQMKLKIPKLRNFIHKCYVECSREIYQNVYLFDNEDVSTFQKQKNIREVSGIIKDGIVESVEKLLPTREIIKTYLGKIYDDDEDTSTSIVESGFEKNMFMDFAKKLKGSDIDLVNSDNDQAYPSENEQSNEEEDAEESKQLSQEDDDDDDDEEVVEENAEDNVEEDVKIHSGEQPESPKKSTVGSLLREYAAENPFNPQQTPQVLQQPTTEVVQQPAQVLQQPAEVIQQPAEVLQQTPEVVKSEQQNYDFMNYIPKVPSQKQISEQVIQQIEKEETEHRIDAEPVQKFVQNNDEFEAVSVDESTKYSELDPTLKRILPATAKNETTNELSSGDEDVKKIQIARQEQQYRMEKEERRRRKILRHKHKKQKELLEQPQQIRETLSSFLGTNAPEYVEDSIAE